MRLQLTAEDGIKGWPGFVTRFCRGGFSRRRNPPVHSGARRNPVYLIPVVTPLRTVIYNKSLLIPLTKGRNLWLDPDFQRDGMPTHLVVY